ncbi:uncharacterized protein LOC143875620 [Tasmannia lanceolata]|uniref:uncharacterized protein LOC143875620 n=1 Tax=Tasmannia lanceolata TaxID=3420 RepID=UPI00406484EB
MNSSSKRERRLVSDLDLISNLPGHVIDIILVHLPIKDAVKMSVLSRNWRYKWVMIPEIAFDVHSRPSSPSSTDTALANIVSLVLLQHKGQIHKFKCSQFLPSCSFLDSWVFFLSKQGIKEIILEFPNQDYYNLPSSLFSCQQMYCLRLENCIFNLPPAFKGFHCLKILNLNHVTVPNDELEFLISNSLLLESLTLRTFSHHNCLKINAPSLRYLDIRGQFEVISFENTILLASATILLVPNSETDMITNVLQLPPGLEELKFGVHKPSLQYNVPQRLPNTFLHLKRLTLLTNLKNPTEYLIALCLLRSSHNLQKLIVGSLDYEDKVGLSSTTSATNYWETKENTNCTLNRLRRIYMVVSSTRQPEMEFIKLLLVSSPLLETLTFCCENSNEEARIFEELMQFPRASSKAEIVMLREQMNSSSKRERGLVSDIDLISNLPGYIVDNILVHLPIKDAVGTSILSRNWRYKWASIPEIVFMEQSCPHGVSLEDMTLRCVKIAYQVLLQHRGPIQKFKCFNYVRPCSDFDTLLLFLSRQGIKEIILDFSEMDPYKLPSSLFSCEEMYCLKLYNCFFNIPPAFEGFRCLKILYLEDNIFSNDELEFLISNSPLLESLTFLDCFQSNRLKINAPNLQHLHVEGRFNAFSFENTPILATAIVCLVSEDEFTPVETCSFTKLLSCLCNITKLDLGDDFLKVFASGDIPDSVPNTFDHLKELSLDINFKDPKQILTALCLLRSSLNLQVLWIQTPKGVSGTAPIMNYWKAQDHMDCRFNHLRTVNMYKMCGVKPELEFIELLLVNAPVLETLIITESQFSGNEEANIFKELMGFRRVSAKATIIYSG